MKHLFLLPLISILLLSACTPTGSSPHKQTSGGHMPSQTGSANLTVDDRSTDSEIAFSVRDGDETFSGYGISHTKEMHLIVVRDDLRYFHHLHPKRDTEGTWHTAFEPPAGGTYWLYADFIEKNKASHTIRFQRAYQGKKNAYGIAKNFERVKTVDGYRFEVDPELSGNEVTFPYTITSQGQSVKLEEYLGALGHSVLISPKGDFIHTHASTELSTSPSEENSSPVFVTTKPSDDFYRIFTQFQIDGKVVTVEFDWEQ